MPLFILLNKMFIEWELRCYIKNMNKKKIVIFLISLLGISACTPKVTVNHKHTYSDEWSFDENNHFHDATCEDTDLVKDIGAHTFGEWKTIKAATTEEEGMLQRTCSVCGYFEIDRIAKKDYEKGEEISHPFSVSEAVEFLNSDKMDLPEVKSRKYYVKGIVDVVNYFGTDNFQMGLIEEPENYTKIFVAKNIEFGPGYDANDYNERSLVGNEVILCGYFATRNIASSSSLYSMMGQNMGEKPIIVKIDDTKHVHIFSDDWASDDNYHWHPSTCIHINETKRKVEHSFGEWITETAATESAEGRKYKECSVCKKRIYETISKLTPRGSSIDNPFTIEETIELMQPYSANQISNNEYYVKGIVNSVTYDSKHDSYTIFFEGYEENAAVTFELYSGVIDTNLIDETYSADNLIGKEIIVHGYLKLYVSSGKNIYEMAYLSERSSPTGLAVSPKIVKITNLTHEHTFGSWITETPATATTDGLKYRICSDCDYREEENIPATGTGNGTFTLYTFNDFHGAVNEYERKSGDSSDKKTQAGLARFGTYLKKASNNENTLIVDSGDTFQGSMESNYNRGAMITDVFNYAHVDVHTLGNHDFDWGKDKIVANRARSNPGDGWHMTNLACNIYDYTFSTQVEGNTQQSTLGQEYYIKTLENGIKVGVIGGIGANQITSILSPLVEDVCFKNEITYIKNLSDKLRTEEDVDVVIASIHAGASSMKNKGLSDVSPVSGKKYCDYVACAHSHLNEKIEENGVYYTQASCNGGMMYKATFTMSSYQVSNVDVAPITYSNIVSATSSIDTNISSIISTYSREYLPIGEEVIASSVDGTFTEGEHMPNLLCEAAYSEAKKENYDVDLAYCNTGRTNVLGPSWTYSNIYECFPFDNVIYIVKIKGKKNIQQVCSSGNNCYHDASLTSMNEDTWYTVAVIDYLLWHTNSYRSYDYFDHSSSCMQIVGTLKKNNENYLYRDVCVDYIRGLTGTISAGDYKSSASCFSKPSMN